ncbi:MAG: A1S_2505 family phage non-structural protein [Thermoplasmataceae archaeon]
MSAQERLAERMDLDDLICVFGSNQSGRHGKGAAQWAARFRGAQPGVGSGRTGQAYAIPTKDEHIRSLSLMEIRSSLWKFAEEATATPDQCYQMTKIGCGLAGIPEAKILSLMTEARLPGNVWLPGTWVSAMTPGILRLMVSVDHIHRQDRQICDDLDRVFEQAIRKQRSMEVVTADAEPMDRVVMHWCDVRGVPVLTVPSHFAKYAHAADSVRNVLMAWYATHLLAYPVGEARMIYQIVRMSRAMGVKTVVRDMGAQMHADLRSVSRRVQDIF